MEAVAILRNVPTSARKMRMVADLIRGHKVNKALYMLKYESKEGAARLEKLLLSAISNWQNANEDTRLEDADLYIKSIKVDGGKMLKRFQPAPQGRAHRIRKRSNHVTLVLDSKALSGTAVNTEKKDNK
jgi:large subunit ribosomal protein L22